MNAGHLVGRVMIRKYIIERLMFCDCFACKNMRRGYLPVVKSVWLQKGTYHAIAPTARNSNKFCGLLTNICLSVAVRAVCAVRVDRVCCAEREARPPKP
jgi:hypothetical protein